MPSQQQQFNRTLLFRDGSGVVGVVVGILDPANSALVGWYNAANVIESAGVVSQMTDLSLSSNHLTHATVGKRPLLVASSLNGHPTVNYDGVDDILEGSGLAITAKAFTIILVNSSEYTAGNLSVYSNGNTTTGFAYQIRASNTRNYGANGIAVTSAGIMVNNVFEAVVITNTTSDNFQVLVNNVSQVTGTRTFNNPVGRLTVGGRFGDSVFSKIKVAELLIYNRVLTASELTTIYAYINAKYLIF